jgi:hypothetical protein
MSSVHDSHVGCASYHRLHRRSLLKGTAGLAALWLTPLAERLARAAESPASPPLSLIVLWLQGGPSQLDTFDPHPSSRNSGGVKAIRTAAPGLDLAAGFENLAEQMPHVALIRSVHGKEGDHERATYNSKTGFRPDPTLIHPSIGAIICQQLPQNLEIPRHVSIAPGRWPARGGYLGDQWNAFKINDPAQPVPDVRRTVDEPRFQRRVDDLFDVVESEFARGRLSSLDEQRTLHATSIRAALKMMSSEQLAAFDIHQEPQAVRELYGDTQFGRGCLAARRLIEAGVRCVEVTLDGWDSHVNNQQIQRDRVAELDPAFAALLRDLRERQLLERTIVLCAGEFGRTPRINPLEGRDHWPHGFTVALAGARIQGGRAVGASDPDADPEKADTLAHIEQPQRIADVHATVLAAMGLNPDEELMTRIGRPMKICDNGRPIAAILRA